ncbi:MAG: multidrug efflux SMR transporter [Actinobacteria bacterium]|nr:multidrug efflux SMR transporter [Actinomycetota bacterium]
MAWFVLIIAGLLEVVWASLLEATEGFRKPAPTAGFVAALVASMYLLAKATEDIPVGTAYAVWVGIGAVGAVITGIALRGEPVNGPYLVSIAVVIVGIIGVKLTAPH